MAEECGIRTFKSKKRRGVKRRNIYAKFVCVAKKDEKNEEKRRKKGRKGREKVFLGKRKRGAAGLYSVNWLFIFRVWLVTGPKKIVKRKEGRREYWRHNHHHHPDNNDEQ